jgi:O-antigen ligase
MVLLLLITYLSLTYLSIPDLFPQLVAYPIHSATAAVALLVSIVPLLGVIALPRLRLQLFLMSGFTAFVAVSWLLHGWLGGVVSAAQRFFPAAVVYFLGLASLRAPWRLTVLRIALAAMTVFMLVRGIQQYGIVNATREEMPYVMLRPSADPDSEAPRLRGLGILGDPNVYAQFLLIQIPLFYVSRGRAAGAGLRLFYVIPLTLFYLYGIYLTRSRGAIVGLGALVWLLAQRKYKVLGSGIGAGVAVLAFFSLSVITGRSDSPSTGEGRLAIWSDGLGMFKSSPLWGVGFRAFADTAEMNAHNSFLLCAAELGIIGYFLWMALLVVTAQSLRGIAEAGRSAAGGNDVNLTGRWAWAVQLSLYLYLITGFFLSSSYAPQLYMLLGMAGALIVVDAQRRGPHDAFPARTRWPQWSLAFCLGSLVAIYIMVRLRTF